MAMPATYSTDAELLQSLSEGDENALRLLVDRYSAPIYRFALRFTGDEFLAEDVSQEVFLRVYRHAGKYDPGRSFKAWLFAIARNASIDAVRSHYGSRRRMAESHVGDSGPKDEQFEIPDTRPTPEDQFAAAQRSRAVLEALQTLPDNQRTALILQYFEGLSVKEISAVMRTSISATESLLIRAKRNLAKFLSF